MISATINLIQAHLNDILGQLSISAVLLFIALSFIHIGQKKIVSSAYSMDIKRKQIVFLKNITWLIFCFFFISLWGKRLESLALSIAAVAGAILIVSKELILNMYGYWVITFNRPFSIGDFIAVSSIQGKVIDYNLMHVAIAESDVGQQLTGKIVRIPTSQFVTGACTNLAKSGDYIIDTLTIYVPISIAIQKASEIALEIATASTGGWMTEANEYLELLEKSNQISLPSARPRIFWESMPDVKSHKLVIRFTCPKEKKVECEQAMYIQFWKALSEDVSIQQKKGLND